MIERSSNLTIYLLDKKYVSCYNVFVKRKGRTAMEKFLGTARTVDELLEMIDPYRGFSIILHGCDYGTPSVDIYCNEEEESIELI